MGIVVDGKQARAAIEINYKLNRGKTTNSVRSLGVVEARSLKKENHEIIEGSWE